MGRKSKTHQSPEHVSTPLEDMDAASVTESSVASLATAAAVGLAASSIIKPAATTSGGGGKLIWICVGIVAIAAYAGAMYYMYRQVRKLETKVNDVLSARQIYHDTSTEINDVPLPAPVPEEEILPESEESFPSVGITTKASASRSKPPPRRKAATQSSSSSSISMSSPSSKSNGPSSSSPLVGTSAATESLGGAAITLSVD